MPRAHVYRVLQNADGSVLTGASVRVLADGASTNLADTLYTSDAGSSALMNPWTSTDGKIDFYLDNPQRIQIGVTPPGSGEFFVTVDADPDALYQVVSAVPRLSLGTPVAARFMHVNDTGQIEYIPVAGTSQRPIANASTDYSSLSEIGEVVLMTGSHTVTLPAPSTTNRGCVYTVKNVGTGTVTITPTSGTIDGAANFTITVQYSSVDFVNDGTNWFTV